MSEVVFLFVLGGAAALVGDHGHVATGTIRYFDTALTSVPFLWSSPIWFPVMVGAATVALAELRLHLGPSRSEVTARQGLAGVAAAVGTYVVTALVHTAPVVPATTFVVALAVPRGSVPDALYWDTPDPYHYVRLQPLDELRAVALVQDVVDRRARQDRRRASGQPLQRPGCQTELLGHQLLHDQFVAGRVDRVQPDQLLEQRRGALAENVVAGSIGHKAGNATGPRGRDRNAAPGRPHVPRTRVAVESWVDAL